MKLFRLLSLAGALCLATTSTIHGHSHTPQSTRFDVDVTVVGKLPHPSEKMSYVSGRIDDMFLSFSAPVQVPTATLSSGSYIFTRVGSSFVWVTSADRKTVYTTFMTVPVIRIRDIKLARVQFQRGAPGDPPRILEVYPQRSSTGYKPVYLNRHKGE